MIVYFKSSNGNKREIGVGKDREECFKVINDFLVNHNYKAPYYRSWNTQPNETCIDVGSHTEFFYLQE